MAKKYDIGAKISLDGEKESKKAISDINAGLKVNYSEMQLLAAQYDKNAASQEAYTKKMDAFSGLISAQKEKVDTLRAAYERSIEVNGEGSKKTLEWQASLNLAESQLVKTEKQMEDYRQTVIDTNASSDDLADAVRSLADGLGLDLPPLADKAIDKLEGISASGAALIAVLAGVVFKLGEMSIETSQTADDILTMSDVIGISTTKLQEFQYASELVDVSTETMQGSLAKMTKSMGDAAGGASKQAEAYRRLKVDVTGANNELRDAEEVYYEVIDALGQVGNETERDYLAMQIFGRSAKDLNPLIEAGSERLKELAEEAHKMGYVLDEKTLESFGNLDDAMQRFDLLGETLTRKLGVVFLPVLTSLLEVLNQIPAEAIITVGAIAGVVGIIVSISKAYNSFAMSRQIMATMKILESGANVTLAASEGGLSGANAALAGTNMALGISFQQLLPYILAVVAIIAILILLVAILSGKLGEANKQINMAQQGGAQMAETMNQFKTMNFSGVPKYALGTNYHRGGPAIINDDMFGRGGEVVELPSGSRVFSDGSAAGGDTIILNVKMDEVDEVSKLLQVVKDAKSKRRRGWV